MIADCCKASKREPRPILCGVYYLWDGARVIYIGSSENIAKRISQWRSERLDFAGYFIDECKKSDLLEREASAIRQFRPILNEQMALRAQHQSMY